MLQAAGRPPHGKTFEETVIDKLDSIDREVKAVKRAVAGKN